jgi:hypothetical protein
MLGYFTPPPLEKDQKTATVFMYRLFELLGVNLYYFSKKINFFFIFKKLRICSEMYYLNILQFD